VVEGLGGLAISPPPVVDGQQQQRGRAVGIDLDRLGVRRLGFVGSPQRLQRAALQQVSGHPVRIAGDHLVRLLERLFQFSRVHGELSELELRLQVVRVEARGFAQLPEPLARLAVPQIGARQSPVRGGVVRIVELEYVLVLDDRLAVLLLFQVAIPPLQVLFQPRLVGLAGGEKGNQQKGGEDSGEDAHDYLL
jgi:hypothetical protein